MINEDAPTMSAGNGGFTGSAAATGPVAGFDPLLGSNKKVKRRKYGTKKDVKEAKVDKKLPDHKRATARDKRYGNPHGSHELGGGIRKDRRADHEARRGVKEEKGRHPRDQKELDRARAYIKKHPKFGLKDKKDVKEDAADRYGKSNYLPFLISYDGAESYVLYGKSPAEIKIQLRKIYRPENHSKIKVKRLYPNEVIQWYWKKRQQALTDQ